MTMRTAELAGTAMRWNQDTAKRATRAAQIGVVAAALIAALVFFLPAPDVTPAPPEPPPAPRSTADTDDRPDPFEMREDWTIVAASLEAARFEDPTGDQEGAGEDGNNDEADGDGDDAEPEQPEPEPEPPPVAAAPPGFRYLGYGETPTGRVALIQMAQLQRFVRIGDEAGSYTVSEITPEHVIVSANNRDHRIERQAPTPIDLTAAPGADDPDTARERRLRELERIREQRRNQARNNEGRR